MARVASQNDNRELSLDDVDWAIIEQLQEDGRRPYGRIGEAVGLSEAAVRQRIQRMIENDAMKIVAVTNPWLLGNRIAATVGVQIQGEVLGIAETIAAIPQVDYVVLTSGSFDILFELQCRDQADLLKILNDYVRPTPGVLRTETFIYLSLFKQTYPWPPDPVAANWSPRPVE
jgi:Lrp/AsnC family transcriptional regulator for asnA, asnC and gidA